VESAVAWKCAIENTGHPTALIFTRQGLPHQSRSNQQLANIERGGYVLREPDGQADVLILATGSEVGLAVAAADELSSGGVRARIISMPNPDLFLRQEEAYRESVIPADIKARVAVEAGVTSGWNQFVGDRGIVVGVDQFGASAPAGALFEEYGLTVANVSQAVRDSLAASA
jgi:transketolase